MAPSAARTSLLGPARWPARQAVTASRPPVTVNATALISPHAPGKLRGPPADLSAVPADLIRRMPAVISLIQPQNLQHHSTTQRPEAHHEPNV